MVSVGRTRFIVPAASPNAKRRNKAIAPYWLARPPQVQYLPSRPCWNARRVGLCPAAPASGILQCDRADCLSPNAPINVSEKEATMRTLDSDSQSGCICWRRRSRPAGHRAASAAYAMGATSLNSIEHTAAAWCSASEQAHSRADAGRAVVQRRYTAAINTRRRACLTAGAPQSEYRCAAAARSRSGPIKHGASRQRQARLAGGRRPGGSQSGRGRRSLAPNVATPHGVIKAALANWRTSRATPRPSASRAAKFGHAQRAESGREGELPVDQ